MNLLLRRLTKAVDLFKSDSLFRNAVFLMSSTAIMSVLGFGFWFFVAHLYTPADIGVASALISITLLASNLSFLGLNSGLVRFLPTSKSKNADINASLVVVAVAAMLAAIAYLIWVGDDFSGRLRFFDVWPIGPIVFVLLMAIVSLNTFTDSVFIANRRAELHTVVYAVFGVVKLIVPLFLIAWGSLGVFGAYVAAASASLALSLYLMRRYCGYRFLRRPNWSFISSSRKYASNNYFAILLSGLPSQVMPSLIIKGLGAAGAAYFAMAWTMANLLYVIPSAITNSLMAESSHDMSKQAVNLRRAVVILALTLTPAVILAILISPWLLSFFGRQYATHGSVIFQLFALATFFMAINSIGNAIMNLEHRSRGVLVVQAVIAVTTIGLAWTLMPLGLIGIGLAFIGGNIAGNLVQLVLLAAKHKVEDIPDLGPAVRSHPGRPAIDKLLSQYDIPKSAHKLVRLTSAGGKSVYRVGDEWVLKIFDSSVRSREQLQDETNFTNFLATRDIPVPRQINNKADQAVTAVMDDARQWLGVLMHFEAGDHPTVMSGGLVSEIARVHGRMHEAGLLFAKDRQSKSQGGSGSLRSPLLPKMPSGYSHFDYDASNILVLDNAITCVVDFEGMRYDPLVVCVFFSLSVLYEQRRDAHQLEAYLRAYQKERKLNWLEKPVLNLVLAIRFRSPRLALLHYSD